ncbi:hypothetical protein V6N11_001304 [Hibiscus sabdariffa]|uniref:Uncharacterized protein n=1 Tax=Hibiscus sabdariffa TaxID=183260 RepID=A0ABR2RZC5_9ROSI
MSGQNLLPFSGVPEGTAVGGASSTIHSHDVVRPPELGGQVFSEPILERLGSPPTVEDERVAKKVRNETALVNDVGVADSMEIEHASLEVAGLDGASDVAYDSTRFRESSTPRVRASYVSMVRNSSSGGHQSIDPDELTPDKVIVRDEDCVIDRSRVFPKIQFADCVHEQIDLSMRQTIIVRLLGCNIGYQTLLSRLHALWRPLGEI